MIQLLGITIASEEDNKMQIVNFTIPIEFKSEMALEKYRFDMELMMPGKRIFTNHREQ